MDENINTLKEFITSADKSRKYPHNTALGLSAALKLFEAEMNEDEKKSLSLLVNNLDQIYASVFQKNKTKMSAGSLQTYKSRVSKVIADYENYGKNATKMASWNPTVVVRKSKQLVRQSRDENVVANNDFMSEIVPKQNVNRHELNLGDGRTATISTPGDLTLEEVKKISAYINYLRILAGGTD